MTTNPDDQAGQAPDAVLAGFTAALAEYTAHATNPGTDVPARVRIDRIAVLEQIRAAVAAAQEAAMVEFARAEVATHEVEVRAGRLDPAKVGRGIGEQIGLACHVSPFHGSRRLTIARDLTHDLPQTAELLAHGQISEQIAEKVVSETRHLDRERRRQGDKQIVDGGLTAMSVHRARMWTKTCAYEVDHDAYLARGRTARRDRRVSVRPAPDTMGMLTAFLPVELAVACYAALCKHADSVIAAGTGGGRTREQIMADTLVERVTGQVSAGDVNVEVGIVMPITALLDPERGGSAEIVGHGPIPAGIARDILATTHGKRTWRRLFTAPDGGPLIGCDPRRRRFTGALAHLITIRDHGRCRDAFCDAPARHFDHIDPHRERGPTSYPNGRGVCARGNYVREMPGWKVEVVHDGLGRHPHTVRTTTPTGHTYTSTSGPAP